MPAPIEVFSAGVRKPAYSVALSSGTAATHLALRFLGVSGDVEDEIRTVNFWSPSIASYLLINKGSYFEAGPIEDLSGNSPLNCRSAVMADLNNDGLVSVTDFLILRSVMNTADQGGLGRPRCGGRTS